MKVPGVDNQNAEKTYETACLLMKSSDLNLLQSAIEYFELIPDYEDSVLKLTQCREKLQKQILRAEKDRKYMKLNIGIICVAMIAILAMLVTFILTLIFRDDILGVREFTEREPVSQTQQIGEESPSEDITDIIEITE